MSLSRRCSSIIIALAVAVAAGAPLSPSAHGASWSGQADRMSSVEDLGRGILAALREGSFDALVPYLGSVEDLGEVLESMIEAGAVTEEQAQQFIPQIPGMVEALLEAAREDFERIQEKGINQSVSWDQAEVTDYRIIIRDQDTLEERTVDAATLDAEQPMGAQIYMRFAAGGTVHELNLGDCSRTSRGWIIMERFSWPQAQR